MAAGRAEQPSITAAIASCDRPDVALRLAFAATENRKAVIRYAANIIPSLRDEGGALSFVRPYPSMREVVDAYADNGDHVSTVNAHARAFFLGTCAAVLITFVVNRYVWVGMYGRRSRFGLGVAILIPLFTLLIRVALAWLVRRKAARLDDHSAFELIVGHVTRAVDKDATHVPKVMRHLRRNLIALFEPPADYCGASPKSQAERFGQM